MDDEKARIREERLKESRKILREQFSQIKKGHFNKPRLIIIFFALLVLLWAIFS